MSSFIYQKMGAQQSWVDLPLKDASTIYYFEDTRGLAIGNKLYTEAVRAFTGNVNSIDPAAIGILYFNTETGGAYRCDAVGNWITVIKPVVTVINSGTTVDDETIPTAKAVKTYVDTSIANNLASDKVIADLDLATEEVEVEGGEEGETEERVKPGILKVTMGDSTTKEVALSGVAHNIEYDAANLKFTIPMVGEVAPLIINLPKDNFIEDGRYDAQEEALILTMKNGSEISIPVATLIDMYTSGSVATDTVTIAIDPDNNKISATIKVDTTGVLGIDGTGAITIDLSAYATITSVDNKIGDLSGSTVKEYVDTAKNALNSRITTDVNNLREELNDNISAAVTGINGTITSEVATLNSTITSEVATLNSTITSQVSTLTSEDTAIKARLTAVEGALTWGTF